MFFFLGQQRGGNVGDIFRVDTKRDKFFFCLFLSNFFLGLKTSTKGRTSPKARPVTTQPIGLDPKK